MKNISHMLVLKRHTQNDDEFKSVFDRNLWC